MHPLPVLLGESPVQFVEDDRAGGAKVGVGCPPAAGVDVAMVGEAAKEPHRQVVRKWAPNSIGTKLEFSAINRRAYWDHSDGGGDMHPMSISYSSSSCLLYSHWCSSIGKLASGQRPWGPARR